MKCTNGKTNRQQEGILHLWRDCLWIQQRKIELDREAQPGCEAHLIEKTNPDEPAGVRIFEECGQKKSGSTLCKAVKGRPAGPLTLGIQQP
jgi:hypothetical protein